jgi:tRNA threonylcarbamoyladenosine biosynthesis protein TsaB
MKLIAIDTSSVACSAAVQNGADRFLRHEEQPREHTRLLVPMIHELLGESGLTLPELDAIVLGNGPGSFIGMRIAASVAQGLAYASSLQIVPVSSMAAVAARVMADNDVNEVVVAQDAHMQQVYLGIYTPDADGLPVEKVPERLHGMAGIEDLDTDNAADRMAAGFGWQRYPELLVANRDRVTKIAEVLHPQASELLDLGRAALAAGKDLAPHEIVPAYLRQKVAEKPDRAP